MNADVIVKLGVNAAQDFEILFGIRADDNTIRAAGTVYGVTLCQEFGV